MPEWITPLLWPLWCAPTTGSLSITASRVWGRRSSSSRAAARPTMPAPTTTTSYGDTARVRLHGSDGSVRPPAGYRWIRAKVAGCDRHAVPPGRSLRPGGRPAPHGRRELRAALPERGHHAGGRAARRHRTPRLRGRRARWRLRQPGRLGGRVRHRGALRPACPARAGEAGGVLAPT